jgi:heme exporter protein B
MTLSPDFARARAVAWKDLRTERRSLANFSGVLFLALLMLLLFGFALGPDAAGLREAAAGIIWLAVLFSGVLAFNRSYQVELAFVLGVEVIVVPLAAVLFHADLTRAGVALAAVMLLGTVGFVTLGTFYAAVASRTRAREVLLPLLLLPMLVPVLIAAAKATGALTSGDVMGDAASWIRLLVAFDLIFLTASLAVYDVVIAG